MKSKTHTEVMTFMKELKETNISQYGNTLNDFIILSELGHGSYATVFKVQSKLTKTVYVLKKIPIKHLKPKHQHDALQEVKLLRKLSHPNIIRYYTSFIESEYLYILMEYAAGGDLQQLIRKQKHKKKLFTEKEIWKFAFEILQGLSYLHGNHIIHRDIKCLNIFLDENRAVKIGDLGVSKLVENMDVIQGTRVGTPLYLSPELITQKPYDCKIDIWATGCVLYQLATLETPFQGDNLITLGQAIVNNQPKPISSQFSSNLKELIEKMMSKKANERPAARDLVKMIAPYFKKETLFDGTLKSDEQTATGSTLEGALSQRQLMMIQNNQKVEKPVKIEEKKQEEKIIENLIPKNDKITIIKEIIPKKEEIISKKEEIQLKISVPELKIEQPIKPLLKPDYPLSPHLSNDHKNPFRVIAIGVPTLQTYKKYKPNAFPLNQLVNQPIKLFSSFHKPESQSTNKFKPTLSSLRNACSSKQNSVISNNPEYANSQIEREFMRPMSAGIYPVLPQVNTQEKLESQMQQNIEPKIKNNISPRRYRPQSAVMRNSGLPVINFSANSQNNIINPTKFPSADLFCFKSDFLQKQVLINEKCELKPRRPTTSQNIQNRYSSEKNSILKNTRKLTIKDLEL